MLWAPCLCPGPAPLPWNAKACCHRPGHRPADHRETAHPPARPLARAAPRCAALYCSKAC